VLCLKAAIQQLHFLYQVISCSALANAQVLLLVV